jgi:hypothetical protein
VTTLPATCPTCGSDDPEFDRFHGCGGSLSCDSACERCEDAWHGQARAAAAMATSTTTQPGQGKEPVPWKPQEQNPR